MSQSNNMTNLARILFMRANRNLECVKFRQKFKSKTKKLLRNE